jgi:biopolymer transport protein ExbD
MDDCTFSPVSNSVVQPNWSTAVRFAAMLVVVAVAGSLLVRASRHTVGYRVLLLQYLDRPNSLCESRALVVQIRSSDIGINQDTFHSDAQFNEAIKQALIARAEKVVYVSGDPEVSYDSVLQRMDALHSMFADLRIILLTPSAPNDSCRWRLNVDTRTNH